MKNTRQTVNLLLKSTILGLLAILAIGCGSSQDDFVVTNNNQVNPNGNLVFRFVQAQTATVPVGTINIQFDLYDGPNGTGNLIDTVIFPFASVITITDVPPNVQSVVITALGAGNVPTRNLTANVAVVPGTTSEVDLSGITVNNVLPQTLTLNPDPLVISGFGGFPGGPQLQGLNLFEELLSGRFNNSVLFDNGFIVDVPGEDVTYSNFSNGELLNVSADGLFVANSTGNTTVDASYSLNGTTVTDSSSILVEFMVFNWADADSADGQEVDIEQGSDEAVFGCFFNATGADVVVDELLVVTISPPVSGVSVVDNGPGEGRFSVSVDEGVQAGTTITVNVSFTDPESGRSFSDTLTATVIEPVME